MRAASLGWKGAARGMRGQVRRRRAAMAIAVLLAAHPTGVRLGPGAWWALRHLRAQGLVVRRGGRWRLTPAGSVAQHEHDDRGHRDHGAQQPYDGLGPATVHHPSVAADPGVRPVIGRSPRVGCAGMTDAVPPDEIRPARLAMMAPGAPGEAQFLDQFAALHAGRPIELIVSLHPGLHHEHLRDTVQDLLNVTGVALVRWPQARELQP